jgi:hypothetical protein
MTVLQQHPVTSFIPRFYQLFSTRSLPLPQSDEFEFHFHIHFFTECLYVPLGIGAWGQDEDHGEGRAGLGEDATVF